MRINQWPFWNKVYNFVYFSFSLSTKKEPELNIVIVVVAVMLRWSGH